MTKSEIVTSTMAQSAHTMTSLSRDSAMLESILLHVTVLHATKSSRI
jgi:hypothetical protein